MDKLAWVVTSHPNPMSAHVVGVFTDPEARDTYLKRWPPHARERLKVQEVTPDVGSVSLVGYVRPEPKPEGAA